jgi:hypothetical protein
MDKKERKKKKRIPDFAQKINENELLNEVQSGKIYFF